VCYKINQKRIIFMIMMNDRSCSMESSFMSQCVEWIIHHLYRGKRNEKKYISEYEVRFNKCLKCCVFSV
jgi:hypothetical protein